MSEQIYKRPINLPRTGHELVTCHYPLRLDTYSGCIHNCVYCYAKNLLEKRGYWRNIRKAGPRHIERLLEKYIDHGQDNDIGRAIRRRVPFRIGGLTDCFQRLEKELRVTKQILEILNRYEYPYLIVTKSPLVAEYTDIIENKLAVIQITITTLRDDIAKLLEPGSHKPSDRLKALKHLSECGFFTTARYSPIIPYVNLREAKRLFEAYSKANTKHVLVEFFRGTEKMLENIERLVGVNLRSVFVKSGYYYRFNLKKKILIYKKLKAFANELDMSFSICSDGDPVPFQLNDTENCCGTDSIKNFRGVERVASALFKEAKIKRKVTIDDMKKYWTPVSDVFEEFWSKGEFERFIFGLKWTGDSYTMHKK